MEIWDFPARRMATKLLLPGYSIGITFFSPRGNLLAVAQTGPGDPRGKAWTVPDWEEISLEGISFEGGFQAIFSPDDRLVAASYGSGDTVWWDLRTRRRFFTFEGIHQSSAWLAFSPDGQLFATGGVTDGQLNIWDTRTLHRKAFGRTFRNGLQHLIFSPDGQRLAAYGAGPRAAVKLWDSVTGREVATLPGRFGFVNHLLFSPDGNTLLAATIEGDVLVWDAPSFDEIEQHEAWRNSRR